MSRKDGFRVEDGISYIRAGTIVEVVEVSGQNPVRGRLVSPPGWISLLDPESSHRWACRVEADGEQGLESKVEADLVPTPRASVVITPASRENIGKVYRKPRAKARHRRDAPKDAPS
eukprot:g13054.t1